MTKRTGFLWALLAAAIRSATVCAQDKTHAVVEVRNVTEMTISYRVRWGESSAWGDEVALQPGITWYHWWPYDSPNQNRSPTPYIRFALRGSKGRDFLEYKLAAFASSVRNSGGKPYYFDKVTDNKTSDIVNLYEGTKSQVVVARSSPAPAPAAAPAQAEGDLIGSTWSGKETLNNYGDLAFRFQADGKAVMVDKDGDTPGTWNQVGTTISIQFGKSVSYVGIVQRKTLAGTAKSTAGTWTFSVSNPGALAGTAWSGKRDARKVRCSLVSFRE